MEIKDTLPYYVKNPKTGNYSIDVFSYINHYSNPNISKEIYSNDNVEKSAVLWDVLKTKLISRAIKKYLYNVAKDFQTGKDFFKKEIEKKDSFYKKYSELYDKVIEDTEKFLEIILNTKKDNPNYEEQINHLIKLLNKAKEEQNQTESNYYAKIAEHKTELHEYNIRLQKFASENDKLSQHLQDIEAENIRNTILLKEENNRVNKEKENIAQVEYDFLKENKNKIINLESKLQEYNNIVLDYKNKELLIKQLIAEKDKIKEETKRELLYVVQSNIQNIVTDHPLSYIQKEEYNFLLKTAGFQELETKLKEIVDANQKLFSENNYLKISLEKLKGKLISKTENIKEEAKKKYMSK